MDERTKERRKEGKQGKKNTDRLMFKRDFEHVVEKGETLQLKSVCSSIPGVDRTDCVGRIGLVVVVV